MFMVYVTYSEEHSACAPCANETEAFDLAYGEHSALGANVKVYDQQHNLLLHLLAN